ncbi:MAG: MFS transporter [Actinobacteria bacterium]|nr:MFS transporter [Actinomycetota bacterium]
MPRSRRPTRRRRSPWRPLPPGFGALWTTVAVDLIGFGIVFPILPRYAQDLNASPTTVGLVVASFSLAQLACAPLMGRLSDRFGRKPVLLVSLCGTAIGSVMTGLAHSVALLLLGRIVDGASGASVSVAQAAVADVASPSERPRLFGLLGAAFGVGFVLGPAIAALAALDTPRLPFFVAAAIAAVNAVVAVRRLPETRPARAVPAPAAARTPTEEPTPAAAAASTAPAGEGLGRDEPSDRLVPGLEPPGRTGPLSGLPGGVVRLMVVAFAALVAFSGFEATFALLVERRLQLTLSSTAGVFTAIGAALVVVQVTLVHPAVARLGETGALRAGLGANAAGLLLLALDAGWPGIGVALVLLVVGQGLVTPTMASAVAALAPARRRGQVLGAQQSAGSLARVVGPTVAGVLFGQVSVVAPYLAGGALVVVAVLLVPAARSSRDRRAATVPLGT